MEPKRYIFVRGWIAFTSIFGMFMAVVLFALFIDVMNKENNFISSSDAGDFTFNSYGDFASYKIFIPIVVMFAVIPTFVLNYGLVKYALRSSNEELIANKWSLAVLSLSLGGLISPMALSNLPDMPTQGTKNARVTIVRYFGTAGLLAAIGSLITIAVLFSKVTNKDWTVVTGGNSTQGFNSPERSFWIIMGVIIAIAAFCLLTVVPFYSKNANAKMMASNTSGMMYRGIAVIYTVAATILLVLQIITAFLRLLGVISDLAQSRGALETVLNIARVAISITYTIFLVYIITRVIKGLWQKETNYHVTIPQYRADSWQPNTAA